MLASTPAQNYGDLLRSLPGVNVIQLSARDVNITNRQGTSTLSNSQLVLLDDRSIYLDFFGLVLWDFLPANMSDIKQIEVIRGPASAVWGANALTGVVNMITKIAARGAGHDRVAQRRVLRSRHRIDGRQGRRHAVRRATPRSRGRPTTIWSYRVSAGYFNSDPLPRPTGRIPLIPDPRDPTPPSAAAPIRSEPRGRSGTAFENEGTSQPKFDARVDQEIKGGASRIRAASPAPSGIIHTGIGPFTIQPGSSWATRR